MAGSLLLCPPVPGSPTSDVPSAKTICHIPTSQVTSVQAFPSYLVFRFFFSLFDLVLLGAGIELRAPHMLDMYATTELHSSPHA